MKCSRNDKLSIAKLHGLRRKHWRWGWESRPKVLQYHAQTSNYVRASAKIQFASGKSDMPQQEKGLLLFELLLCLYYPVSISKIKKNKVSRTSVTQTVCRPGGWEVSHRQGGYWVYKYNFYPGKPGRSKAEPIPEEIEGLSTDQRNKTGAWFLHWVRIGFSGQKFVLKQEQGLECSTQAGAAAKMSSVKPIGK